MKSPHWRIPAGVFSAVLLGQVACFSEAASLKPLQWQKVPGGGPRGSVLGLGSSGAFDERANFTTHAFKDGSRYALYYGGSDAGGSCAGINGTHWRIGLARSTDGLNFTRVPGTGTGGAVLDLGSAGHFDD